MPAPPLPQPAEELRIEDQAQHTAPPAPAPIHLRVHPSDHPLVQRFEEELGDGSGPAPGETVDEARS
ncbi:MULTISPECIES: hypothetical protein [unclassified Streptomyces]|uniref:hypothetical protein n=1 Tax=unclassified Streptomyces TaxID=2593676 RepID=UPI0024770F30|nr:MULTISPECIES: hypothetical protein [unclassified Streptomyces]MDH6451881.1 hypothetical protein [Streptomyces sp. SAI-119]MDH6497564.1 hypothetical protein [Streptomyces sp. SAI-149]